MKNMKKLLSVLTMLGLTTISAVNVIACSKPTATNDDLTKSFTTSYNAIAGSIGDQANWGLSNFKTPAFTFNFASIQETTITNIVKPIAAMPVTLVTKATTLSNFPTAKNAGDELAQITQNTADGTVNVGSDNKTVVLKFTLQLWKDNGSGTTTGSWIKQSSAMDVSVSINTSIIASDLAKSFATTYNTAAGTIADQAKWGLSNFSAAAFTFNFLAIDATTLTMLIKPSTTSPIILVTKATNVADFPTAKNVGDEVAQITQNTTDGSVKVGTDNKTVTLKFTLKLWKADSNKNYVDQTTKMDISVNIDTTKIASDLAKSFVTTYNTAAGNAGNQASWGLTNFTDPTFSFSYDGIDADTITAIIKPITGMPVTLVTKATNVSDFPAAKNSGDELAQITQNTTDGSVNLNEDNKTITLKFTLQLWKADSNKNYADQKVTMDVTVNIDTTASANDLTNSFQTLFDTTAATVAALNSLGLSPIAGNQYNYKFSDIDADTITAIIKPGDGMPVTLVTKATNVADFPPAQNAGDELAQIMPSTPDSTLTVAADNKTVTIKFTLKLWKDNGTAGQTGNWINQFTTMDVSLNIDTTRASNDLSRITQIDNVTRMNLNSANLKAVTETELLAAPALQTVVQNAVKNLVAATANTEYTYALAADASGKTYTNLDLTRTNQTFVQITAKGDATNIIANSQTNWIAVSLPVTNDLGQITSSSFGSLIESDFTVANASAVTKAEIINGIKTNGTLLAALKAINSNITDISNLSNLSWKISKTATGADLGSNTIDASGVLAGVVVYITLTPGTTTFVSGTAQDSPGQGIAVRIPHLNNS